MSSITQIMSEILRIRNSQLMINKKIIANEFLVPVHLAIGHETLAVCSVAAMHMSDKILLTHRNIHFQLALGAEEIELENEYLLHPSGLAQGRLGSMNLVSKDARNVYTSNILGNNLAVALGFGLAAIMSQRDECIWVVTGDGAIEEGVFHESLLMAASWNLPIIYIIENNAWSLATTIEDRRVPLDLEKFASSMSLNHKKLQGNDPIDYLDEFALARQTALLSKKPQLIEVMVETLGGFVADPGLTTERYINYHAGAAQTSEIKDGVFLKNSADPVFVVQEMDKS